MNVNENNLIFEGYISSLLTEDGEDIILLQTLNKDNNTYTILGIPNSDVARKNMVTRLMRDGRNITGWDIFNKTQHRGDIYFKQYANKGKYAYIVIMKNNIPFICSNGSIFLDIKDNDILKSPTNETNQFIDIIKQYITAE